MKRVLTTCVIAVSQLVMVGLGVAPQLSARLTGDTYLLQVAPVDPVDPLRGAYVALDYPGLRPPRGERGAHGEPGTLYVTLVREGDAWTAGDWTRERPDEAPYLACDDRSWQTRCGIESWFLPQDEAQHTADLLRHGALAEVRIDARGHAAVVGVRAP